MAKTSKIEVDKKSISIIEQNSEDYICLTDMVRGEEGEDHIRNWMRNRNTVEFIGLWETLHNPDFKPVEFDTFRKQAGLNSFNLTPKKWIEATNAIGIFSKSGRYGGTYDHKDIAFEFGSWISPMFKLLLIKEFQRLKEIETNQYNLEWNVKRILTKTNHHIHTEAIKNHIIPDKNYLKDKEWLVYAEEADVLNVALFGCTAKDWREVNKEHSDKELNIRDFASINELVVLSNLENVNAILIERKENKENRFIQLSKIAKSQLVTLDEKATGAISQHRIEANSGSEKIGKTLESSTKTLQETIDYLKFEKEIKRLEAIKKESQLQNDLYNLNNTELSRELSQLELNEKILLLKKKIEELNKVESGQTEFDKTIKELQEQQKLLELELLIKELKNKLEKMGNN